MKAYGRERCGLPPPLFLTAWPQLGILNAELFIQAHAKLYPTKYCLVGYKLGGNISHIL